MRKVLKWAGIILLVLLAIIVIAAVAVALGSNAKANEVYDIETAELTIPTDAESIAEGQRQASIRACNECHGADYAGQLFIDDPALGTFYTSNLTTGAGSAVEGFTVADWERAIRHGVGRDGKPLFIMPSTDYYRISDEDLGRMIAYFQTLEPVDQEWPAAQIGPVGRVLVATGQLPYAAAEIDHSYSPPESVTVEVSAAYGDYLAATCTGCHRPDFSGGPLPGAGPDDTPAANLTPAGNLGNWSEEDFITALRTGVTPEGKTLDPELMPWPITTLMSDDELQALWLHFESLPPVETDS
jgi:cytochrome c553